MKMMFRMLTRTELVAMRVAIDGASSELAVIESKSKEGCKTCDHLIGYLNGERTTRCSRADGAEIPADVVPLGCPSWQSDPIPF